MPGVRKASEPTQQDWEGLMQQIADTAASVLDPASSRTELVEALREIHELASPEDGDDNGDESDDEPPFDDREDED